MQLRLKRAIKRFDTFEDMKADEYAFWQKRPDHERIAAVSRLTRDSYGLKGSRSNVQRLQRTLVRIER